MNLPFTERAYTGPDSVDVCVRWKGVHLKAGDALLNFLRTTVASRLNDAQGKADFAAHLDGLELTGMGRETLAEFLEADVPEERSWAAGEALSEAILMESCQVVFPWNMERDKRNEHGSLPGADIVGFIPHNGGFRLVFGEVKTSGEKKHPPQVMSGRSGSGGLAEQLETLAHNRGRILKLLEWLHPRCKNTEFQKHYDDSLKCYFEAGGKDAALFGILIRDTAPNALDLQARGQSLAKKLVKPTSCELVALHLPCPVNKLIGMINGEAGK